MNQPKHILAVQHSGTSFYFQCGTRWTPQIEDAFCFNSVAEAERFCRERAPAVLKVVKQTIWKSAREATQRSPQARRLLNSMAENKVLCAKKMQLAAAIDSLVAQGKERRKKYPFKPKGVG